MLGWVLMNLGSLSLKPSSSMWDYVVVVAWGFSLSLVGTICACCVLVDYSQRWALLAVKNKTHIKIKYIKLTETECQPFT